MSFVSVGPEAMLAKAADLAGIASTIRDANALAAAQTASMPAVAADQVSAVVAQVFNQHAQAYQNFGSQMASFHDQIVATLTASGNAYASAEAANVQSLQAGAQSGVLDLLNGPGVVGQPRTPG
jgi:hypothetical protein